jgi:DNA polymerase-3 subunit delta'
LNGFSSILGHEGPLAGLRRAAAAGRVANAYLFEGAVGIGKAATALALAQALNCDEQPNEGCGRCEPCRKIDAGLHPDVLRVEPEGQFIKIAQVRQLTARAAYRPHEGRARLVILDPADALNPEAGNALLKTLEEPPAQTHFVLVSAAPDRLPVTVRSRCQRVRFAPLPVERIAAYLERAGAVLPAQAQVAAGLCGGSIGRALDLLAGEALERRRELVDRIEQAVAQNGFSPLLAAAAEIKDDKETLPQSLELLRVLYRDALLRSLGAEQGRLVHVAEAVPLGTLAALGPDRLRRRIEAVLAAETALRANVNPQLCLERMMLRLREC